MMRKRKLRCLTSVVLSIALCGMSVASANAADLGTQGTEQRAGKVDAVARELIKKDEKLKVQEENLCEELVTLEKVGLETEFIETVELSEDEIVYVYELPEGVVNKISVDRLDTETVFNIQENNIYNEVRIDDDGTMYIDGEKVAENDNSITEMTLNADISPYSGEVTNWLTSTCPYGSKGNYTYLLGSRKDPDITLTTAISNLTTTAVMLILAKELAVSAALSNGLGVVINWIKDRYPSTKGLSYKATNYAHKNYTNTYIGPIKKYAYRSDFTWYPNKNYKGNNTYKETMYFIKQIG